MLGCSTLVITSLRLWEYKTSGVKTAIRLVSAQRFREAAVLCGGIHFSSLASVMWLLCRPARIASTTSSPSRCTCSFAASSVGIGSAQLELTCATGIQRDMDHTLTRQIREQTAKSPARRTPPAAATHPVVVAPGSGNSEETCWMYLIRQRLLRQAAEHLGVAVEHLGCSWTVAPFSWVGMSGRSSFLVAGRWHAQTPIQAAWMGGIVWRDVVGKRGNDRMAVDWTRGTIWRRGGVNGVAARMAGAT